MLGSGPPPVKATTSSPIDNTRVNQTYGRQSVTELMLLLLLLAVVVIAAYFYLKRRQQHVHVDPATNTSVEHRHQKSVTDADDHGHDLNAPDTHREP